MRYVSFFRSVFYSAVLTSVCFLFLPVSVWSAEVSLTWEAPDDDRVTGYNVYYGEAGASFQTSPVKVPVEGKNNNSVDLPDIKEGVSYSFAVTSTDGNENESEFSEIIEYTYLDYDDDGVVDNKDGCPEDPAKTEEGACGCGNPDTDTDGDGVADCNDEDSDNDGMPDDWEISYGLDPLVDDSGGDPDDDGISNLEEYRAGTDPREYTYGDTDGDGVADNIDLCPEDENKTDAGACGCGIPDTDTDGDGVADCNDEDSDNDGMPDDWEISYGLDPLVDDSGEDSDGDGISNLTEYKAGTDPLKMTYNISPDQPVLVSPGTGTVDVDDSIVFETSSFVDADDDEHGATHWQISRDQDFTELVFEKTSENHLTRLPVSKLIFSGNSNYYWRAQYVDKRLAESAWSLAGSFTTGVVGKDENRNGISDDSETTEQTDLDGNGIPDMDQNDMKVIGINPSVQLGLQCAAADGEIAYLEHIDPFFVTDEGKPYDLPFGLINFKIKLHEPGQKVVIPVHLSESVPENAGWYKYDSIDGWADYSDKVTFGPDRKTIFIELEDGGIGDADGVANGIIIDPSGLAINPSESDGTGDEPGDGSSGESTSGSSSGGGGGCFIDALF